MLYFHTDSFSGLVDSAATFEQLQAGGLVNERGVPRADWLKNRNDLRSFAEAEAIAASLNRCHGKIGQTRYVATDSGSGVYPRYDVIEAPQVGDKVSRAFNGDYYPAGVITSISKTLKRITTDSGAVFTRKRQSGCWSDGGFALVPGHISRYNPEF